MATRSDLLEEALRYAALGWEVFPLAARSKVPKRGSRGLLDATSDAETVREWWSKDPNANIGLNVGRSGLVCVDVDPRHNGDATWSELVSELGEEVSRTVASATGGGGSHFLYRRNGKPVRSVDGALGPGVDTKSEGGYIVLPPSIHPNGRAYACPRAFFDTARTILGAEAMSRSGRPEGSKRRSPRHGPPKTPGPHSGKTRATTASTGAGSGPGCKQRASAGCPSDAGLDKAPRPRSWKPTPNRPRFGPHRTLTGKRGVPWNLLPPGAEEAKDQHDGVGPSRLRPGHRRSVRRPAGRRDALNALHLTDSQTGSHGASNATVSASHTFRPRPEIKLSSGLVRA